MLSAEAAFAKLERNPFAYQLIYNNVRRVPVSRFPFGLFYVIETANVYVLAVFHSRRNPSGWQSRFNA